VLFSHVEEGVAKVLRVEPVPLPIVTELRRRIGKPLDFSDVSKTEFEEIIRVAYDKGDSQATRIAEDLEEDVDLDQLAEEVQETTDLLEQDDDAPIKKFINVLLGQAIREKADHVLYVPPTPPLLSPVVSVIPLQLLAYHVALRRGCDVDQPRNLAKSVTVE